MRKPSAKMCSVFARIIFNRPTELRKLSRAGRPIHLLFASYFGFPNFEIVVPDRFREYLGKTKGINSLWFPSYFYDHRKGLEKMNLKIANLVAIQFGIFIGTMSWLIYSRLPSAEPGAAPAAPEMKGRMVNSIRPEAPVSDLSNQRPGTVAYGTDRPPGQPVNGQPVQSAPIYYQTVATGPYARSGFNNAIAMAAPYAGAVQEPATVSADYAVYTEPVGYAPPAQLVVYTEPIQTVGFSNSHRFRNRGRPAPRACGPQTNPLPRLNTLSAGPSGNRLLSSGPSGNVLSQGNANGPACPPVQGFRPPRSR